MTDCVRVSGLAVALSCVYHVCITDDLLCSTDRDSLCRGITAYCEGVEKLLDILRTMDGVEAVMDKLVEAVAKMRSLLDV
jgi:hypothetical protein